MADLVKGNASGVAVLLGNGDGDGNPDLMAANQCAHFDGTCRSATVGVVLGNGNGTFQPVVIYDAGGSVARSIAVADLNRDQARLGCGQLRSA